MKRLIVVIHFNRRKVFVRHVLHGKRRLTREQVARLARYFQVDASVFAVEGPEPRNGTGRK